MENRPACAGLVMIQQFQMILAEIDSPRQVRSLSYTIRVRPISPHTPVLEFAQLIVPYRILAMKALKLLKPKARRLRVLRFFVKYGGTRMGTVKSYAQNQQRHL